MTVPEPQDKSQDVATTRPPAPDALKWLTMPLLIELVSNAISLLALPFAQEQLIAQLQSTLAEMGMQDLTLTPAMLQSALWTTFFVIMALTVLVYFTREGVKEGKGWAWVMSILIGVLLLLSPPFGTIIGVALLYGAFRPEVRAYFGR